MMIQFAMVTALCLVTGCWPQAEGASNSWHDVYPYDAPSATTQVGAAVGQVGPNQRQSFTRRQLAGALASLLGNPAVIFSGLGVSC